MKRLFFLSFIMLLSGLGLAQQSELTGILPQSQFDQHGNEYQIETNLPRGGRIWALDWSPNGQFLAVGNRTGHIRIYETNSFKLVQILFGFETTINGISWSPDNLKIAASGFDPRVIIWDVATGNKLILEAHKAQVRDVEWSPNGVYLASSSHDGRILIWDRRGEIIRTFKGAGGGCVSVDWLNDQKLAAACWDNTVRTYNMIDTTSTVSSNGELGTKAVLCVDWHPSGDFFATGDYGNASDSTNNVRFWSKAGQLQKEMSDHTMEIRSMAWSPDGRLLASGGEAIRLWDQTGSLIRTFHSEMEPIWSVGWNDKSTRIASGHNNGKVIIWDLMGNEVARLDGHSSEITAFAYRPDSLFMAVGFANGELRLLDLQNMSSQSEKINVRSIHELEWSPVGPFLAVASYDSQGSIWKVKKGKLVFVKKLIGHVNGITALAWHPNGKQLASVANESRILVWNKKGKLIEEIQTNNKRHVNVVWENNRPKTNEDESSFQGTTLPIKANISHFIYVPLKENQSGFFDQGGKLHYGNAAYFNSLIYQPNQNVLIQPYEQLSGPFSNQDQDEKKYLFFLHNRFLETNDLDAKHETFGRVEYQEIISSFERANFTVISEQRKGNVVARTYAMRVVNQIDSLISLGVQGHQITVVGTSKGGYIAQYVSTLLENQHVNYVFIGCFQVDDIQSIPGIQFCGNILTIYDSSDSFGVSALRKKELSTLPVPNFKEIELHTGLGHGFLFKALTEWIQPCIDWGNGKY